MVFTILHICIFPSLLWKTEDFFDYMFLFSARMAESQMMGRAPFYSPLHSMVSYQNKEN